MVRLTCTFTALMLPVVPLARAGSSAGSVGSSDASSWIWLPGEHAPHDAEGNRAAVLAPRPGDAEDGPVHAWPAQSPRGGVLCGLPNWAPFGPAGADADCVRASPAVDGLVLVGISSAVGGGAIYRSLDGGASWTLATGTGNRAIRDIAFGNNGIAWAATNNGLFRSVNDGQLWTPLALPLEGQVLVEDVVVDPVNPLIVWAGIGQFLGGASQQLVFKTTDGGAHWNDVSPPVSQGMGVTVLEMDPADSQRIIAAFTPNFGGAAELWLTFNGGATWVERSAGLPEAPINAIAFGNEQIYVAGGQDFGSQYLGLFRSTNDGVTWVELSAAWPSRAATSIALDPADPQVLLVGTTRAGLTASEDGGTSWTHGSGGTGTYQVNDVEFLSGLTPAIFLGMGSVAVFKSTDGGATFVPSSAGISRLEITSFAVNPLNNSEIAASYISLNEGGIFISADAGQTWSLSQAPMPRWQSVYFAPNGTLYGTHNGPLGRADDGLWRRNADGTWTNLGPGSPATLDNIGLKIAATAGSNPKILWIGYRWQNNFGAQIWSYNRIAPDTWEKEFEGTVSNENAYTAQWMNGGAGPTALVGIVNFGQGAGRILRSTNFGDTWAPSQNGFAPAWNAWDLVQSPHDPASVYVAASANTGTNPAAIYKSSDSGMSWTQQGTNPVYRYLAADAQTTGTLYALSPFNNAVPQRSTLDGAMFLPFDTNYIPLAGGRDLVYAELPAGLRVIMAATAAGGFATQVPLEPPCPGDTNCDGAIDVHDAVSFALALTDVQAFISQYGCELGTADMNNDGSVDGIDVQQFVETVMAN